MARRTMRTLRVKRLGVPGPREDAAPALEIPGRRFLLLTGPIAAVRTSLCEEPFPVANHVVARRPDLVRGDRGVPGGTCPHGPG
jgi:hypothetical protein